MPKDIFNQTSSSISSKPVGEAQGFAATTQADLNNDVVELYLSFLSPDEIAKTKRVSWGCYEGANQALKHYRLFDKDCQKEVGLKFLKLELSHRQNFLLVQNSQGQRQVYAWGVNGFSQLGLGHNNAVTAPSLLPFPGSLANWMLNNIVASGSGNSAFAIFQNAEGQSQVYAWGANRFGGLGLGHNNRVHTPTLIPFFKGATGPGQLPLQKREILGALTGDSEAASSSTAVSSNQSSRSSSLKAGLLNAYSSSQSRQSSLSQTASSSLTAELEQKCVVAQPKPS